MKGKLFWDSFLGTVFIFFLIGVVFRFSAFGIFNAFDPIGEAMSDIEITDIVFSRLRETPPADTNVVLVNIGTLPRAGIAEEINIISKYDPKVIGLDCFFEDLKDPFGDSLLKAAIQNAGPVVMASRLHGCSEAKGGCDSLGGSLPYFTEGIDLGYANLISTATSQEKFKTNRTFAAKVRLNGERVEAFGVKLARYANSLNVQLLLNRKYPYEVVNFRGYGGLGGRFFSLDVMDVFTENFDPGLIKDKIVIFGFMGQDFSDKSWEDKYFTPLNPDYAGRTNPDMFGVTIHANIIAMILNKDFIGVMGDTTSIIWAILICFLNVLLFNVIYYRLPLWYDGLTKLIQLVEVLVVFFIIVMVFHYFSYKINITLGIVAILLAGDSLEVYQGVGKNTYRLLKIRFQKSFKL